MHFQQSQLGFLNNVQVKNGYDVIIIVVYETILITGSKKYYLRFVLRANYVLLLIYCYYRQYVTLYYVFLISVHTHDVMYNNRYF